MNSSSTNSAIDKASSAVHSAIDSAASKAKAPVDRMTQMAHDVSDKAASAGTEAGAWLADRTERLSAPPKKLISDTSRYVSANPLKSVGIAVIAALLVGRLMR